PMNHPLDLKLEATYGYNPLELAAYAAYRDAMSRNPKLLDALNVSRVLRPERGTVEPNPSALPRAYFAGEPARMASVVWHDEQGYRIHCRAGAAGLLRVSVPYFPGWRATAGGVELPVQRVDEALIGVAVSAGEREITLRFRSNYFGLGAALSAAGILLAAALALWERRTG
ncbi:MAG: YfhO family protein, partial [Candidatus Solibacter usitatus]|nr:YfhO family protein [Candidatus Solibacter usitatus]